MAEIFKVPPQIEDQLFKAFLDGARQSIHAKNPDGSDGGLPRFLATVANRDPVRYMQALINKLAIEHET
jgi:hypothetical protein